MERKTMLHVEFDVELTQESEVSYKQNAKVFMRTYRECIIDEHEGLADVSGLKIQTYSTEH